MNKVAVDSAAKDYWKLLWADYGEALCRDMPRRIKASLAEHKKVAAVDESATLKPLAHARVANDKMVVEGLYKDASSKLMFRVTMDNDGNIVDLKTVELR
jgi:hypothetical protein